MSIVEVTVHTQIMLGRTTWICQFPLGSFIFSVGSCLYQLILLFLYDTRYISAREKMECSKLLGVVAVICLCIPMVASSSNGQFKLKVNLTRRSEGGFNSSEQLRLAVDRSKKRMNAIEAFVKQQISGQLDAQTPVQAEDGEFLMRVAVGTPSVTFEAVVDTGSDLVWTKCNPCQTCSQSTPIFDPSKSSSYSPVSCTDSLCNALGTTQTECNPNCTFSYGYADGSRTTGDLAKESLSVGNGSDGMFAGTVLGCGHDIRGFSQPGGLVGLGRGNLSLISQLGSKVDNKFSYCLVSRNDSASQTSPLIFGDSASLKGAKTIPFIKNSASSSFWYIPLTGITVNGKAVDIPAGTFDLGSDGSGGMIIDSGTTLTYLVQAAYDPVKEAIESAINMTPAAGSPAGFDLCYQKSSDVTLPTAIFNFRGGMDYELPGDNLFIQASDTLMCLAMGGTRGSLSIFGNVQQQNFHILYDNAQNSLSFMPAKCDSLK